MLRSLMSFLGGALRALIGLVLVFGALALGFIAATGVLLRLAWLRAREARASKSAVRRGNMPHGEVIDVVVREIRAR